MEHDISIAHGCASVFANSTVRMLSVCIQTQATLPTVVHPSDVYCGFVASATMLDFLSCLRQSVSLMVYKQPVCVCILV